MKALLPASLLLAAVSGAGVAWFAPVRADIQARKPALDERGQPTTAQPLSSLTPEVRAQAEDLLRQTGDLEARLDAHEKESEAAWNALLADVARENARREVEGRRIGSVLAAAGGKGVEGQVEELMDETARRRAKGFVKGWIEMEAGVLKSRLALSGTQATAIDQAVADILKEEGEKIDASSPDDNFMGWRGDVMKSARGKFQERLDIVLTGEQKATVQEWWKDPDWGKAFREQNSESIQGK
ncbi:MAG: hypothetical protein HUU15_10765 [Candidatus Brocadiae bacterium]|nr:hypothetical protein [Candidatus Brocadiia bacterium]